MHIWHETRKQRTNEKHVDLFFKSLSLIHQSSIVQSMNYHWLQITIDFHVSLSWKALNDLDNNVIDVAVVVVVVVAVAADVVADDDDGDDDDNQIVKLIV